MLGKLEERDPTPLESLVLLVDTRSKLDPPITPLQAYQKDDITNQSPLMKGPDNLSKVHFITLPFFYNESESLIKQEFRMTSHILLTWDKGLNLELYKIQDLQSKNMLMDYSYQGCYSKRMLSIIVQYENENNDMSYPWEVQKGKDPIKKWTFPSVI